MSYATSLGEWISRFVSLATAAYFLLLPASAVAQTSQFLFDPNGNLTAQTGETIFPPQIIGQPQNQVVAASELAAFSVIVADPRSLTYQWRFNNANLGGSTNAALLLENVSASDEGEYRVVLTNPSGSVTSAPAILWIDNDGDGMGDSWETAHFGGLGQTATADADGDGVSNLQEFLDDTDPSDPNSTRYRLLVIRDGGSVVKTFDQVSYTNGESVTLTAIASPGGEPFHAWLGDIVTRSNPVTLVMTNNKTVFARFTTIDFLWTKATSGDWETATNWTPNLAPGLNDNVVITNGVTVALNTTADCAQVALSGAFSPTLTGSGSLTIRSAFLWTAGTMSGSGRTIVESNATLTLAGTLGVTLSGRTLENGGTVLRTGTGSLALQSGAVITNRPGAIIELQSGGAVVSSTASNRIDNAGSFRKLLNTGTTTIPAPVVFNNSGPVEILGGTLNLAGGGTNTGSFSVAEGAGLNLAGGVHLALVGSSISGGGHFTVSGGTAGLSGLVNVSGSNTFSGGTADLTGNYICTNNTLTISGGTANFNGTGTVAPAVLNLSGGTLGGNNTVTVGSQALWTGGTMSGVGRTMIAPGATLNVNNSVPGTPSLSGRVLENGGAISFTGSGILGITGNAVITNRPGGVFNFENEASIGLGGGIANGRFDNAGTFRKSAGTGTSTVVSGLSLNNSGTVEIQAGTLLCNGGFTNNGTVTLSAGTTNRIGTGGGSATGLFTAPATALVEWTSGTFTLNSGAQLNGTGLYKLNGGNVTANANLTVENLDLVHSSSSLSGSGAVTVVNGMNWTAGTMSGNGRTIVPAGVTLNAAIPSSVTLTSRTLENGGTILWTGAGFIGVTGGAVITNRAGALFQAQNAVGIGGGIANGRLDNAGTFRKSDQTGATTFASGMALNNFGMVDVRSGKLVANGGYTSTSNALLNCALGGTVAGTNYGQLQVAGTVTLNGGLSVDLLPGFSPATNDTFTVVTAGTRNNAFTSFSYPSNRVTMLLSNSPSLVVLRATGVFPIPQPVLLTPQLVGSNTLLTWTATSNVTYRLEFNPALTNLTNWAALAGDVTTVSNTASKLDPLTPGNRFYRVRVLP
jgi:hypothetical protein